MGLGAGCGGFGLGWFLFATPFRIPLDRCTARCCAASLLARSSVIYEGHAPIAEIAADTPISSDFDLYASAMRDGQSVHVPAKDQPALAALIHSLPAVGLALALNLLDAMSYGLIIFDPALQKLPGLDVSVTQCRLYPVA